MPRQRGILTGLGLALTIASCADATTGTGYDGIDQQLLTPVVAAQLDSRGRFREQQVESGYINPRSRADADSLARRFIAASANSLVDIWEDQRGAEIEPARLARCSPIRYAASAHEITLMGQSQRFRQILGGQYWMLFCGDDDRPALRVQVPVEPALPGSGFSGDLANIFAEGVAVELEAFALIGPEEAVRLAAARSARRVAAVPELTNERYPWNLPRWIVRLEFPVAVRGNVTLQADTIDFVLVGPHFTETGGSFIPSALRPFALATIESRLDTIVVFEGDPIDIYTARIGMPKRAEPFRRIGP